MNTKLFNFCCERRDLLCSRSNGDIFTCEDNTLFSRVKISCFRGKAHLVFHCCLYNKCKYFPIFLLFADIPQFFEIWTPSIGRLSMTLNGKRQTRARLSFCYLFIEYLKKELKQGKAHIYDKHTSTRFRVRTPNGRRQKFFLFVCLFVCFCIHGKNKRHAKYIYYLKQLRSTFRKRVSSLLRWSQF